MFTGLIIAVTVLLLWFTSYRLYKARRIIKKEKVEWLALAAFMAGFGILCYGVRSLFIDRANIDTFIYRMGILIHIGLCFIPASLFIYKNYINSKVLRSLLGGITIIGSLIMAYATVIPTLLRKVKPAPYEPIPMNMSNFPWASTSWLNYFIWFSILLSLLLIWVAFVYSVRKLKEIKSSAHFVLGILLFILSAVVVVIPFIATQSWFKFSPTLPWYQWSNLFVFFDIALSILLIWVIPKLVASKKIDASVIYGLGIAYLLFPAMLCVLSTPIFARLLYVPGAIFLYLAFRNELKSLETQNITQ
jgi:hypothetical protein